MSAPGLEVQAPLTTVSWGLMTTTLLALPSIMDPMYWLGKAAVRIRGAAGHPGHRLHRDRSAVALLPGDSLLFTGGLLAAQPDPPVNIWVLAVSVAVVAILGDQCAYFIDRRIRSGTVRQGRLALLQEALCDRVARVLRKARPRRRSSWPASCRSCGPSPRCWPVSPTCATRCSWGTTSSAVCSGEPASRCSAISWSNVPFVKAHLELMILLIVFLSVLPALITVGRNLLKRRAG